MKARRVSNRYRSIPIPLPTSEQAAAMVLGYKPCHTTSIVMPR
jgi:hypothetical protein